jgi:outer membrane autotransporter protein
VADVDAGLHGMILDNRATAGAGRSTVTIAGTVTGGEDGLRILESSSGATVTVAATAALEGLGGTAFDDRATGAGGLDAGSTLDVFGALGGSALFGAGDDALTFRDGSTVAATAILDGGADADTLTFAGGAGLYVLAGLANWEDLSVGDGTRIVLGSAADATGADLTVGAGATLGAAGGFAFDGSLVNAGAIDMADGAAGATAALTGAYTGGGNVRIDVDFAAATADTLEISGDVNGGATSLVLVPVEPDATASGDDILLVAVSGDSAPGDFVLADPTVAGAFDYGLAAGGGRWWLESEGVNAAAATHEAAPAVLMAAFGGLPSMQQRLIGRGAAGAATKPGEDRERLGWIRLDAHRIDLAPDSTGSGYAADGTLAGFQAGADWRLSDSAWTAGVTAQYNRFDGTVTNPLGDGSIDATGWGVGATATWVGAAGAYADFQAQANRVSADMDSGGAELASGVDATMYLLGAEIGHVHPLGSGGMLIPQAQLVWSTADFGSVTDSRGNVVSYGRQDRTLGRVGLAWATDIARAGAQAPSGTVHVLGNLWHDFSGSRTVTVAGASLDSEPARTWGELGVGGSMAVGGGTLFGEAAVAMAGDGAAGDNRQLRLNAGWRMRF